MNNLPLVLASTSPYRREILQKLGLPFSCVRPDCDETPQDNESATELVQRLARLKAEHCQLDQPSLVIGSDQVCVVDGKILGKPHNVENATKQLTNQSGKSVTFFTGIALYNTETQHSQVEVDTFTVHFRELTKPMIQNYIAKEQPFDCAGSFKSEGLGIALFERLEGKDPNTLIGLPLITLIDMLNNEGWSVL